MDWPVEGGSGSFDPMGSAVKPVLVGSSVNGTVGTGSGRVPCAGIQWVSPEFVSHEVSVFGSALSSGGRGSRKPCSAP